MTSYVPALIEWIWVRQKVIHVTRRRRPADHRGSLMTLQRAGEPRRSLPITVCSRGLPS